MNGLDMLLRDVFTLAIVCNQWGDTGKGKIVDLFAAEWADIIARGTGGANAGHTIVINGEEFIFHLIPSGILHDGAGKINLLGRGVAFDPRIFCEELEILRKEGMAYNHLRVSKDAHLVLPHHLVLDRVKEIDAGKLKIGTTGRGIGPLYVSHYDRTGLTVNHLLNKDFFAKELKRSIARTVRQLRIDDPEVVKGVMQHEHLEDGIYYHPEKIFDVDAIIDKYLKYVKEFRDMICDTDRLVQSAVIHKKNVLLEGAQGLLLSVDYGAYPYVTSSDPSVNGLAKGVGLSEREVDLTLGIVKAPYMTRVGEGTFPTEMGGDESAKWCGNTKVTRAAEEKRFTTGSVNSKNDFIQGVFIRMFGGEYGATTGRPRRIGCLDLPLLRHAIKYNGNNIILTKLDVFNECEEIRICEAYEYVGPTYNNGQEIISPGHRVEVPVPSNEFLKYCIPIYTRHKGWESDISGIKNFQELPQELRAIIRYIKSSTVTNIPLISIGRDRNDTIFD